MKKALFIENTSPDNNLGQIYIETLKKLGYKKVYLWTDQAPLFYQKIGFQFVQIVEKNEGGYGELYSIDC